MLPFFEHNKRTFPRKEHCNSFCKVGSCFIKHLTPYPYFLPTYFKALHPISLCLSRSLISRCITILSRNYNFFFVSFLSFKLEELICLSKVFTPFLLFISLATLSHSLAWNTLIKFQLVFLHSHFLLTSYPYYPTNCSQSD